MKRNTLIEAVPIAGTGGSSLFSNMSLIRIRGGIGYSRIQEKNLTVKQYVIFGQI
jgi:hypothetical protein